MPLTFTLPAQLRALTWRHQTVIYQLMFLCVSRTLKDFGLNPKNLGAEIGMTAVLHTHSRKLDYHPHIHVIIPGGGINKAKRQWIKTKGTERTIHSTKGKRQEILWTNYKPDIQRSFSNE